MEHQFVPARLAFASSYEERGRGDYRDSSAAASLRKRRPCFVCPAAHRVWGDYS